MALTIQQIQNNITAKNDAREIINQIADYLQANPSGGGSSSFQDVLDNGSNLNKSNNILIPQDDFLAFNGRAVVGGPNAGQIPNFTISDDDNDMWIGTEFFEDATARASDIFMDFEEFTMFFVDDVGSTVAAVRIANDEISLTRSGIGGSTKLALTTTSIEVDNTPGSISGSFTTVDNKTITITKGIVTAIV